MNKKLNIILEKGEYISKENNVLYIRKKLENYLGEERNNHKFKMGNREYYSEYYVEKEIERLNNIISKAINILELSSQNKGICTRPETDTIQSALLVLKGEDKE